MRSFFAQLLSVANLDSNFFSLLLLVLVVAMTIFEETPSETFGALMGQIGGNAGLWCGLSFVLMFEVFEFLIVALLYGTGFYGKKKSKSLKQRVGSLPGRMGSLQGRMRSVPGRMG